MSLGIVTEWLARIEHKLDLIIKTLGVVDPVGSKVPVGFSSHQCPLCDETVTYIVDLPNRVVQRKCKCSTGKMPPTIDLFPIPSTLEQRGSNGRPSGDRTDTEADGPGTKNRTRR